MEDGRSRMSKVVELVIRKVSEKVDERRKGCMLLRDEWKKLSLMVERVGIMEERGIENKCVCEVWISMLVMEVVIEMEWVVIEMGVLYVVCWGWGIEFKIDEMRKRRRIGKGECFELWRYRMGEKKVRDGKRGC